jgi:SAM-dependent methyltransferase
MNYDLAYRVGFHPWEVAPDTPEFVETITELFEEEERDREPPFGRALDVGTGSGIWGVELVKRGWEVTGIDNVKRVLPRAEKRAAEAGVDMTVLHADVTDLSAARLNGEFRLILDTGTFHGLPMDQRETTGRELDAVAAPDATILLLAWEPRRRGPLPRGASREELEAAFPGWIVEDLGRTSFEAPKPVEVIAAPNEHWYRIRRTMRR